MPGPGEKTTKQNIPVKIILFCPEIMATSKKCEHGVAVPPPPLRRKKHSSNSNIHVFFCSKYNPRYVNVSSLFSSECPYPLFRDGGLDVCYFLYDPLILADYPDARDLCAAYDVPGNTHLARLDSSEKVQHVMTSGVFAATA